MRHFFILFKVIGLICGTSFLLSCWQQDTEETMMNHSQHLRAYAVTTNGVDGFVAGGRGGIAIVDQFGAQRTRATTEGVAIDIAVSDLLVVVAVRSYGQIPNALQLFSRSELELVGTFPVKDEVRAVNLAENAENIAFLLLRNEGLLVLDVSQSDDVRALARVPMTERSRVMAVSADLVFVGLADGTLQILRWQDGVMSFIGRYQTPSAINHIVVDQTTLYLANNTAGVTMLDISDPANPTLIEQIDVSGSVQSVAIDETHLYIGAGHQGVWQRTHGAEKLERVPLPENVAFYVRDLAHLEDRLLVAADDAGILSIQP